jgi:hypothetical protein
MNPSVLFTYVPASTSAVAHSRRGRNEHRVSPARNALRIRTRSPHFPRSRSSSASFLAFLAPRHISSLLLVCRRIYTSFSYPASSCIACSCRLRPRCLICILQCLLSASQFPEFHHLPSPQTPRVFTLLSISLLTCPSVPLPPARLPAEFTIAAPRFRSGT